MNASLKSTAAFLLRRFAKLLLIVGVLSFLFGGAIIKAVAGTDLALAEVEGTGAAALCLVLGAAAKYAVDRLEEGDGPTSLGEALRK